MNPSASTLPRKFECQVCHKYLNSRQNLWRHKLVHDSSKKSKECRRCHAKFRDNNNLKRHIDSIHRSGHTEYACNLCDQVFYFKTRLKQHHKEHHYICQHAGCNRRFKSVFQACRHAQTHTKPYVCHICHRKMMYKRQFNSHMIFHRAISRYHYKMGYLNKKAYKKSKRRTVVPAVRVS
jgi:hypothetical protein